MRRWRWFRERERGASAIELALYTPIMFLVIFMIIQFALIYHGNQIVHAAAREGARIARAGGDLSEAQARAEQHAAHLGGSQLSQVSASAVYVGDDYVRVEVCGTAKEIVRNTTPQICRHSEGPIERFQPDG
jgi:Flp pilus assembly protein TadG